MSNSSQKANEHSEIPQSNTPANEAHAASIDTSMAGERAFVGDELSDTSAHSSPAAEGNADATPSPEMAAEVHPKAAKHTKGENDVQSDNKAGRKRKAKTRSKPRKGAKTKNRTERASADQGGTDNVKNDTSGNNDGPMKRYLQGCDIDPAPPPPVGTLPPQLGPLFPDLLSVAAVLATTAAAAGHGPYFDPTESDGNGSPALRVAVVGKERYLPQGLMPAMEAAYALERLDIERWAADKKKAAVMVGIDAARHRTYRQMLSNAALLGLTEFPDVLTLMNSTPADVPRPQFVLRDPSPNVIKSGLEAADGGLLLVDGRRLPTMSGFGVNYDGATAESLNSAATGCPLALSDPRLAGAVNLRRIVVSVIGTLAGIDVFSLHKADSTMLMGTVFVPAEGGSADSPAVDAATVLTESLDRVRKLANCDQKIGVPLKLSRAARRVEEQAKAIFLQSATEVLPPLAYYFGVAADLVRRIAYLLHLLDHAAAQADRLPAEVDKGVTLRAVALVEQAIMPAARNTLAAASVAPEVRDARRILSYIQQYTSQQHPTLARRDIVRIFQRSMLVPAIDRAIRHLVDNGLLTQSNSDAGGGQVHQVNDTVFLAPHQLPDLVSDPRRPRQ